MAGQWGVEGMGGRGQEVLQGAWQRLWVRLAAPACAFPPRQPLVAQPLLSAAAGSILPFVWLEPHPPPRPFLGLLIS